MTKVTLVSKTQVDPDYVIKLLQLPETELDFIKNLEKDPEQLMIYIARVSSPNQVNPSYEKLLKYCLDHKHWSVFEHVNCTLEIETDLNTSLQLIRHKSLFFSQLSRRYSSQDVDFVSITARKQDNKNRQNSIADVEEELKDWFDQAQQEVQTLAITKYNEAINRGIAKEVARYLLPTSLKTKLYVTGNLRNLIHYIEVRADKATQKEHRDVAEAIKLELVKHFPVTAKALSWH